MRLSAYPQKGFKQGVGYRVLMDGRQLKRVVKVDTCAGVAWVHDADRSGNLRIDRKREEIVLRRVFGPMRVEKMP